MPKLIVKVKKLVPKSILPHYNHLGLDGDLAADLFSISKITIAAHSIKDLRTGIAIQMPKGIGAIIESRSGLALKGLIVLGGVIDTGYRGEIKVLLANLLSAPFQINKVDRIAQLRFVNRIEADFFEVSDLLQSKRNKNGFGSSGI